MTTSLSFKQSSALFDILTHADTYSQIQLLSHPGSLNTAGPPFTKEPKPSTLPAFQKLLQKYLCNTVGIRDLPPEFWSVQVKAILENFQAANLSESHDKGCIGNRKTLATAMGALLEYPARGVFGGIKRIEFRKRHYDLSKAEDLEKGWSDFCNDAVWGHGLDELFEKVGQSEEMGDWENIHQAMAEYLTINIASIVHYTLVLSPQGQYILGLIETQYQMTPWLLLRQTLKIGNAATMMSALMKIVLAKVSVASITNMFGITTGRDEGMNLNQRIIASTYGGDIKDFEAKAKKIEKSKTLPKEKFECLREYTSKSREEQEQIRQKSQNSGVSIVDSIFQASSIPNTLTPASRKIALSYLSHQLSIRDRQEIVRVFCRSNPDHLTTVIRMQMEVMDPVIRRAHKAVDLPSSIANAEAFLKDLIKVARIKVPSGGDEPLTPTVADVIQLFRKHRSSLLKFFHQVVKNDPEMNEWFLEAAKTFLREFRDNSPPSLNPGGAGKLSEALNDLFASAPQETREEMTEILDQYAQYLGEIDITNTKRLQTTIDKASRKSESSIQEKMSKTEKDEWEIIEKDTPSKPVITSRFSNIGFSKKPVVQAEIETGPGGYLLRWQELMDRQKVTVEDPVGVQKGGVVVKGGNLPDGIRKAVNGENGEKLGMTPSTKEERPDTRLIEQTLGMKFRELLGVRGMDW